MKKHKLVSLFSGSLTLRPNLGQVGEEIVLASKKSKLLSGEEVQVYSNGITAYLEAGHVELVEAGSKESEDKDLDKKDESGDKKPEGSEDKKESDLSDEDIEATKLQIKEKTELYKAEKNAEAKKALKSEIADLKKKINAVK